MNLKNKKDDGPTCACGKVDLYEEWTKLNENNKEEVSVSANPGQVDDDSSLDDNDGKENQKQTKTEK